jgi:hypothetical protein
VKIVLIGNRFGISSSPPSIRIDFFKGDAQQVFEKEKPM